MSIPEFFQFSAPTKVLYQSGIAADFGNELEDLVIKRPFVITDAVLNDLGILDPIRDSLKSISVEAAAIFDDVPENSEVKVVERAAGIAREAGADSIIAVGGGSVIDTAKGVNILLCEGGNLVDYSGAQLLTRSLKPLVVVPTTAGTGSEVTSVAVILNEDERLKMVFPDKYLTPDMAVLDPEMTRSMPPRLTAATGLDALTHAVEAVVDIDHSPFSDAFAMSAIDLINRNLLDAVKNGDDLDARGAMLVAACLAGIAFNHSMCGCVHAMSHTVGGLFHVAHGVANGILLPFGMEYNLPVAQDRIALLGRALVDDWKGMGEDELAKAAIGRIFDLQEELKQTCDLPIRLSGVGLTESDLPAVAEGALSDGTSIYNPRELEEEEILKVLKKAF